MTYDSRVCQNSYENQLVIALRAINNIGMILGPTVHCITVRGTVLKRADSKLHLSWQTKELLLPNQCNQRLIYDHS